MPPIVSEEVAVIDEHGPFVLSELPDGAYVVQEGYAPYRTAIELRGGTSAHLAIALHPRHVTIQ